MVAALGPTAGELGDVVTLQTVDGGLLPCVLVDTGGGPDGDAVIYTPEATSSAIQSNRLVNQLASDPTSIGLTNLGSDTLGGLLATGNFSTAVGGNQCRTSADVATAVGGFNNNASGAGSSCIGGFNNVASGINGAFATGENNTASGEASFVEGSGNTASGTGCHAEGFNGCEAVGQGSHAEGSGCVAGTGGTTGDHAEGASTAAFGTGAHAEGVSTTASSVAAHAEGETNVASGRASHAEGSGSFTTLFGQHAQGSGPASGAPTAASAIQSSTLILRGSTPGAAPGENVNLGFGGFGPPAPITLTDAKTYLVTIELAAGTPAGGNSADAFTAKVVCQAVAGVLTIRGSAVQEHFGDAFLAGSTLTITAAGLTLNVNYALAGGVTAAANVVAHVRITETP